MLCKLGVDEWIHQQLIYANLSAVTTIYVDARIVVRTVYGNSEVFNIGVGMHQGLDLSPLLYAIVMEAISSVLVCYTAQSSQCRTAVHTLL